MNVQKITTISYKLLRATILLFWIYVGIDKFWQLGAFKIALTQQPVISYFASVLFWLLPVIEISIGVLLAYPSRKLQELGWRASTILIAIFTIYIGLGILDVYDKKPCMCTSFLTHISWTTHFLFNIFILMLSILGLMLSGPFRYKSDSNVLGIKKTIILLLIGMISLSVYTYKSTHHSRIKLPLRIGYSTTQRIIPP